MSQREMSEQMRAQEIVALDALENVLELALSLVDRSTEFKKRTEEFQQEVIAYRADRFSKF